MRYYANVCQLRFDTFCTWQRTHWYTGLCVSLHVDAVLIRVYLLVAEARCVHCGCAQSLSSVSSVSNSERNAEQSHGGYISGSMGLACTFTTGTVNYETMKSIQKMQTRHQCVDPLRKFTWHVYANIEAVVCKPGHFFVILGKSLDIVRATN